MEKITKFAKAARTDWTDAAIFPMGGLWSRSWGGNAEESRSTLMMGKLSHFENSHWPRIRIYSGPMTGPDEEGPGEPEEPQDGSDRAVVTEEDVQAQRPNLYKVLLHNDDFTPMEFVVDILERFFKKSHAEATEIMLTVHNKGKGVCGLYPYEIAETKVALVTEAARENEYPLQCTLEKA